MLDKAELGAWDEAWLDGLLLDWVEVVAEVAVEDKAPFEDGLLELICDVDWAEQPTKAMHKSITADFKSNCFTLLLLFYSKSGARGWQGVPPPPMVVGLLLVTT